MFKRLISFVLCLTLCFGILPFSSVADSKEIKNVILLVSEGMSNTSLSFTRMIEDLRSDSDYSLFMDKYFSGMLTAYNADRQISDPASAGTALATGNLTSDDYLGINADAIPVPTVIDVVQYLGKSVGLVSNGPVYSPFVASFYAHADSATDISSVAKQLVSRGFDVIMGTGFNNNELLKNQADVVSAVRNAGYTVVYKRSDMISTAATKLLCDFSDFEKADGLMSHPIDADEEEPTLAEMTDKALSILSKSSSGFFLLVNDQKTKSSLVDGDPVGLISDTVAFDDAVKVAVEYAESEGNTVVVVTSGYAYGGMAIGNVSDDYNKLTYDIYASILSATSSAEGAMSFIGSNGSNAQAALNAYGFSQTPSSVSTLIKNFKSGPTKYGLTSIINTYSSLAFSIAGPTGEDFPIFISAPDGTEVLRGVNSNTAVAGYVARLLGADLKEVGGYQFINIQNSEYVSINDETHTILIKQGYTELLLTVNSSKASVDGTSKDGGYQPVLLINGKYYISKAFYSLFADKQLKNVISRIAGIPSRVTLYDYNYIISARMLYDKLDASQKSRVENYQKLIDAEFRVNVLKENDDASFSSNGVVAMLIFFAVVILLFFTYFGFSENASKFLTKKRK